MINLCLPLVALVLHGLIVGALYRGYVGLDSGLMDIITNNGESHGNHMEIGSCDSSCLV